MPKKTIMATGLLIAAAAGGVVTGPSASAKVRTDGGSSHNRHNFWQHHRNRNWNGNDNDELNHIRGRIHNRNNDIAVARARPNRRAQEAVGRCIDSAVQGNTKFVAVTQNGQIFVQEVTLTPTPTPSFWQNTTAVFTNPFPGFTPSCVSVTVMGDNLHVSALGEDGRVLQAACMVNPPPTEFPASCGAPIDLGTPPSALLATSRMAGTARLSAFRRASGRALPGSTAPVRVVRTH